MKKNITELSLHEKDTGSSEVQIALLTDKIETLSLSFLWVVNLDWPGFLLSISYEIRSKSILCPAGQPSIIPPMALPWDSPKVVNLKIFPKELFIRIK